MNDKVGGLEGSIRNDQGKKKARFADLAESVI